MKLLVEVLQNVQNAEEKAAKIRNQAIQEAREMAKGIESANSDQEKQALKDHRLLLQQLLNDRRQFVEEKILAQKPDVLRGKEELTQKAQNKIDGAVDLITERIMNYGNR